MEAIMRQKYEYVSPEYEGQLNSLAAVLMLDRLAKQAVAEEAVIIPFPRPAAEAPDSVA